MSNEENYEVLLPLAKAIPTEETKAPYMPIGIYTQESEDLYQWSKKDRKQLIAAGVPEGYFEKLNAATGALRYAQSLWSEDLKSRQHAEKQWIEDSPMAFDLRNQMIHTFRYAYRNDKNILNQLTNIAKGSSAAEMIQSLSDLSVLGSKNIQALESINFDKNLLTECATLSSSMANKKALLTGERYTSSQNLIIRNQMYTLLKKYVDEIRNCGKYLFWRNKDRLKGYSSSYKRMHNKKTGILD